MRADRKAYGAMMKRSVGILIFPDAEVLDFCGPFEVFASASHLDGGERLFDVSIVAETSRTVACRGGLLVQPHHSFADSPRFDIIVIPGGAGTRVEKNNQAVLDWIRTQDETTEITASVCTGALLLAAADLVGGQPVTTHWAAFDELLGYFPELQLQRARRVIDNGHLVSSAGVSAGIDMALAVVERLHGRQIAEETARGMEYEWRR